MNKNIEIISRVIDENYEKMEVKFKKSKKIRYRVGDDSELLKLILSDPEEYAEYYQNIINKRYNRFDVRKKLNFLKLSDYKYRKMLSDEVKQISDLLYKMCIINEDDIDNYNEINSILQKSSLENQVKEKMVLIDFSKRCKRNDIVDWTKTLNYVDNFISRSIFRNILNDVAIEKGFKKSKDVGMKVDDIKDQIGSILNEEVSDDNSELKLQNENLKSALILINDELDKYKQDLEKFKDEIELNVISDFIKDLNSEKYGRLLDNFIKCQKSLKELKRNKYEFPVEVESIPILIRQYIKFIQEYGIKEIQRKQQMMLSYEEAAKGNYIGSPYKDQTELKKVVVDSPGWIYKDMIISTPIYIEIVD